MNKIIKEANKYAFVRRDHYSDPLNEDQAITIKAMVNTTNRILEKKEADWRFNISDEGLLVYQTSKQYLKTQPKVM